VNECSQTIVLVALGRNRAQSNANGQEKRDRKLHDKVGGGGQVQ
jgi:hypothetical protein